MANLFAALNSASGALSALETALTVSQNNISNSSTPGYVQQTATFEAMPLDVASGANGGVRLGPIANARNIYAESSVQQAQTNLGNWQAQVNSLQSLQSGFDLTGSSGIPGALNTLYSAFASWGASPQDTTARQSVLDAAQGVAQAFQQQATEISSAATSAYSGLSNMVSQVNTLTARIVQDNASAANGGQADAAAQADLYSNLEQLASIVPITTLHESDGSTTVLLAGQTPLVIGQQQYTISSGLTVPSNPAPAYPAAAPGAQLLDSEGNDITATVTSGQIGGVLGAINGTLARLQGSATRQGSLNQLAQAVADRVNGLLTAGNISNADPTTGAPAVPGTPLFSYNAANPAGIAASLSITAGMTP
ncbi:MAG TPA: flagellar basal body protein, partial [Bryobacteraceae bacterium]|nr:flagellar basal body protein [Bryobacteraceae bacterium]